MHKPPGPQCKFIVNVCSKRIAEIVSGCVEEAAGTPVMAMEYTSTDLAALIKHIDDIKITDDTPTAVLDDSLRVLNDHQQYVSKLIDKAKAGGNSPLVVPLPELEKVRLIYPSLT